VAPADWVTTSLTQLFKPEVPILPLMNLEMCEMTNIPLPFILLPSLPPELLSVFYVLSFLIFSDSQSFSPIVDENN